LIAKYGDAPWIFQVVDAVKHAVQNGIEQLSGTSLKANSQPGDRYRFEARTKEELLASQGQAAPVEIPPGVEADIAPPSQHGNRTDGRQDDGSLSWVL